MFGGQDVFEGESCQWRHQHNSTRCHEQQQVDINTAALDVMNSNKRTNLMGVVGLVGSGTSTSTSTSTSCGALLAANHILLATCALHQHSSVTSGTLVVCLNDCLSDHLHRKSNAADVAH